MMGDIPQIRILQQWLEGRAVRRVIHVAQDDDIALSRSNQFPVDHRNARGLRFPLGLRLAVIAAELALEMVR